MSTETKYYETVDAKDQLPERRKDRPYSSSVWTIYDDGNIGQDEYWDDGTWTNDRVVTHWLRPVNLSDIIREAAGKAWDAGIDWRNGIDKHGAVNNPYPDKETYLNNL